MEVIFSDSSIEDFIYSFDTKMRDKIRRTILLLVEYGHLIDMPVSKKITKDLFELRVKGRHSIRLFYTYHNNKAFIVHCIEKKTQKPIGGPLSSHSER